MNFGPTSTLEEVKQYLKADWENGCKCPACGQYVKLYRRKLNSAMAYGLILISKSYNNIDTGGWFHLEDYLKQLDIPSSIRGDIAKLRWWGLLDAQEDFRDDGSSRVGYYRLTMKGATFVHNQVTVQEKVKLYNQKFFGFDGLEINIREALKSKFNYDELMKG